MAASVEPATAIGFNGGGDINIAIRRGVALVVGYRYRGGPTVNMPIRVTTVVNADRIAFEHTIAEISRSLAARPRTRGPVRITPHRGCEADALNLSRQVRV
jgi:hypothetical protein